MSARSWHAGTTEDMRVREEPLTFLPWKRAPDAHLARWSFEKERRSQRRAFSAAIGPRCMRRVGRVLDCVRLRNG